MRNSLLVAASLLALAPAAATPEVVDSSSGGFTVKTTLNIHAAPAEVYHRLIRNIGDWWNPRHSFSGDSHNLSIEEKVMGCFCEKLPNQGGVRHMEVVFLAPGQRLVMSGALGPLQPLAATATMTIALSAVEGGTKLEVTYAVAGYLPAGMNSFAGPVDSVVAEQFTRLKNYIEHGDPAPK
ncbi:MAG: ATPase [Acidobacteriia bacterium]|nr:ATPase [Terriglobia bacterium]